MLRRSINLRLTDKLDKLFSWAKKQESTLKSAPGKCPPEKFLTISKNILIQQILLIQLTTKNFVVNFQNLFHLREKIV